MGKTMYELQLLNAALDRCKYFESYSFSNDCYHSCQAFLDAYEMFCGRHVDFSSDAIEREIELVKNELKED